MTSVQPNAHRTRLYHRLQAAARVAQRAADQELLASAGVTTAQAAVLAVVSTAGRATQRDVARSLGVNESAVTQLVSRLLKLGLISRRRSGTDARTWALALTDRGRSAVTRLTDAFAVVNAALDEAVPATEIDDLVGNLQRIAGRFEVGSSTGP